MGPFIPRRVKQDWEMPDPIVVAVDAEELRIAQRLCNGLYGFDYQLHRGQFVNVGYRRYEFIRCNTCGWVSEGPVVNLTQPDCEVAQTLHRTQWRQHRAEMAVQDGIEVP